MAQNRRKSRLLTFLVGVLSITTTCSSSLRFLNLTLAQRVALSCLQPTGWALVKGESSASRVLECRNNFSAQRRQRELLKIVSSALERPIRSYQDLLGENVSQLAADSSQTGGMELLSVTRGGRGGDSSQVSINLNKLLIKELQKLGGVSIAYSSSK